jgi:chromosome segregation ATPase
MTPPKAERAKLQALCDEATPGPWDPPDHPHIVNGDGEGRIFSDGDWWVGSPIGDYGPVAAVGGGPDSRFIAAARTALPALLAALDEAEAAVKQALATADGHREYGERVEAERDAARAESAALKVEVQRLTADRDAAIEECRRRRGLEQDVAHYAEKCVDLTAERDAARAEVERLRKALEAIKRVPTYPYDSRECQEKADDALDDLARAKEVL